MAAAKRQAQQQARRARQPRGLSDEYDPDDPFGSELDLDGDNDDLPTVEVLEPKRGWWTNNPAWGRNLGTVMPAAAGVAFSVATIDKTPGPPRLHTVQLFRGDFRPQLNSDVYARVSYGIGGANNQFLCDWGPGAQFSLAADFIRVDALSYAPFIGSVAAPVAYSGGGVPLELGVTFGQGAVAHGRPIVLSEPVRFIPTNTIAPAAGSYFLPIPDFARAFIVRAWSPSIAGVARAAGAPGTIIASEQSAETGLQVILESQFSLTMFDAQIFAGLGEQGCPIPGGANRIVIQNASNLLAGGSRNLNADYQLCIQWVLSL